MLLDGQVQTGLRENDVCIFELPPKQVNLAVGEVHVWIAPISCVLSGTDSYFKTLSSDEELRAKRFRLERDRIGFIVRRGILRKILGSYLKIDPCRVSFRYGPNGKPALAKTCGNTMVRFSLSQSGAMAVFAVSQDYEIGIDIECMCDFPEMGKIVQDVFSVLENEVFRSSSLDLRREAFFAGWTCREALAKARGDGLSQPLDKFDVSLVAGKSAILRGIDGNPKDASRWALRQLKLAPNYLAAVAVQSSSFETKFWRFEVA